MKRQILDLYRRCVPEPVKQWISPRVKASVLGLAYGLTGYPDLRQWQMRHLFRAGPGRWQTPRLHDPLFSCALVPLPSPPSSAETTPAPGRYFAEFGFLGVKLQASLHDPAAVAAGKVALRDLLAALDISAQCRAALPGTEALLALRAEMHTSGRADNFSFEMNDNILARVLSRS